MWDIFIESFITNEGYKEVLRGLGNTLIIAIVGLLIGVVIGIIIAISKVIPQSNWAIKTWSKVSDCYVALFRGTPIIVQLLLLYFVLLPAIGLELDSVVVAFITFGLNSGAYVSEIVRGGILSVDGGQMEAGRSLGLSYTKTMLGVVLPQAFKNILPTLGNEFIALVKETSVVSFIAAVDLTKAFKNIADGTYEYIIPYVMLALCYLVIVLLITMGIKLLERRLRKSDRRS